MANSRTWKLINVHEMDLLIKHFLNICWIFLWFIQKFI